MQAAPSEVIHSESTLLITSAHGFFRPGTGLKPLNRRNRAE